MGFTIDIDTGGTFTDGFFTSDQEVRYAKVPTTPHDLTVCLVDVVEKGAALFGLAKEEFLGKTDVVRYSTTVGTNAIIQRSGPKLGVVVTKGHEADLYGAAGNGLDMFVSGDMVAGVEEDVGPDGVVRPLDVGEALRAIEDLIDRGARTIVVSLRNASYDPVHERAIKDAFETEYQPHYLGIVPLILSTDLSRRRDDFKRTATTIINAYLHRDMVKYLYRGDDELRRSWYDRPLLITHSSGGTARVAKTTALNTYNSGPAAGMLGSARIAKLYDLPNLISTDMGGTSMDIGFIVDGAYDYEIEPTIEGIPVYLPMIEVDTIGAGGGSIAWVDPVGGTVEVGPQSAGAQPGPAAFDLGGTEPTVTDADIVLGYVDADNFLGGTMKLDREKAVRAIADRIAGPLSISVEEAALAIKQKVDGNIGARIAAEVAELGRDAGEFTLLAYGGAGATHCCGYAAALGVDRIITFPYSAVFSAFGSSTADVMHYYTHTEPMAARSKEGGIHVSQTARFNEIIADLRARALHDIRGEGFAADEVALELDLIAGGADDQARLVHSPLLEFAGEAELRAVCDACVPGADDVVFDTFMLRARGAVPHWEIQAWEPGGEDPAAAMKTRRSVYWAGGFRETAVYDYELLQAGNVVSGPAVIDSDSTTYVIPEGARLTVDRYRNGIIEIAGEGGLQ
ncbi:MAG: hydantoinase/oxoprolinase family protein [Thermoleophilia bacterium]